MLAKLISIMLALFLIAAIVVGGIWAYKLYNQGKLVTTMQEMITKQEQMIKSRIA